ncbi:MAG: hypothetical protein LBH43_08550 [Treponema sp.]|jgi:hypothetical protein|nr:hypothetical protein [Treponema sp.]
MKKGKYDAFSKVFAQLSDESQDRLVETAHRLLKAHRFTKHGIAKWTKTRVETGEYSAIAREAF